MYFIDDPKSVRDINRGRDHVKQILGDSVADPDDLPASTSYGNWLDDDEKYYRF